MPEEVFRFVNVRPVQQVPNDRVRKEFAAYDQSAKSPFHREVEQLEGDDARQKATELARQRLALEEQNDEELTKILEAVRKAARKDTVAEARRAVEQELDQPLAAYLKSDPARKLKDFLWDRLYAHTLVPEEKPEDRETIYQGVRAYHFLELLTKQKDDDKPLRGAEWSRVKPTIPKGLVPASPMSDRTWEDEYVRELRQKLDTVYNNVLSTNAAIEDLRNGDRVYQAQTLRAEVADVEVEVVHVHPVRALPLTELTEGEGDDSRAASEISTAQVGEPQIEQKVILVPKKIPWVFEEFGQENLSNATRELLSARKLNLTELEAAEVAATLEQEKYDLVAGFIKNLPEGAVQYVRDLDQFQFILKDVAIPGFQIAPLLLAAPLAEPGSAAARGIQPLGIGDLLVIKQELMRYTAGEVAHIENVLKSEFKTRLHSRAREVEEIIITEIEELEETEKDLQTTERFELQKETQKTIQNQMNLEAGVSITGSYGFVSVTAHADFALSQSSSESSRNASTFAKEVTERSVSRIMRRTREERVRRTLERFEEKNEHSFDNKAGTGHVIGIYRWVDKYYKARLINYGRRLMIEFIVPEPAVFYLYLQFKQTLKGVSLEKPKEPMVSGRRLEPTDLTKWNYTDYVAQYNVQDVAPYPAEVVRVSGAFAEAAGLGSDKNMDFAKTSEKLTVPQGYKCSDLFGKFGWQGISGTGYFAECFIAGQGWGSVTASGLEGIIPISIKGWFTGFHVNVVAICELKPETKIAWQLKTYEAIMNAYELALANYNEQVAIAQIQAGVDIQGRNPELNRKIERDELRKGVLRSLTNNFAQTRVNGAWRFNEMFDAMQANGQFGYPEFDTAEAILEAKIVQFFEQAFEWNNMTYRFYPYFWGRKSGWKDIFPLTDPDPQFTDFLRAGSGRVIIPVHPAYNDTLLHYMATNEIWNGGNPPTLNDPLYISIVDELKADSGADLDDNLPDCAPDTEYPCLVDEWEIKLPTTLVYLQENAKLPNFTS